MEYTELRNLKIEEDLGWVLYRKAAYLRRLHQPFQADAETMALNRTWQLPLTGMSFLVDRISCCVTRAHGMGVVNWRIIATE